MTDYEALFRAERAKNDELEETIRQLKSGLDEVEFYRPETWPTKLTPAERAICNLLLSSAPNRIFSYENIFQATRDTGRAWANERDTDNMLIKVLIWKVRTKLKPFGVEIVNIWGKGYYMPPESREAWELAVERKRAA